MSGSNFIPSDIIEGILLVLPAISLGRFKSVSKTWNSIISDPRFIKTHTHQLHQTKKKLIAISRTIERSLSSIELTIDNISGMPATAKEITIGSPHPKEWQDILGSCNGLVLAKDVNDAMFVMNPTTHDLWKLPDNPFKDNSDIIFARYGFGYDSSNDDYKVLSICFSPRTYISNGNVSIYSLRNNSWRKLPYAPHTHCYDPYGFALVNDNFHWFLWPQSIIAFSLTNELLFTEIKLPNRLQRQHSRYSATMVELGGRLGVYIHYELWVMQEYGDGKSWTRVRCSHRIDSRPVCLLEGSDRDIVLRFADGGGLVVFNLDKGTRRKVRIVGGPRDLNLTIGGSFIETIESPKRYRYNTSNI